MTTRARTARRPVAVANRPRLTWRPFSTEAFTLVGGTNQVFRLDTIGNGPILADLGVFGDYTIRRIRATLGLNEADLENTNGSPQVLFWGMTIVSVDAFSSGTGAVPDPENDAADWFGYGTPFYQRHDTGFKDEMWTYSIDIQSMRKVNENSQTPVVVFHLLTAQTALVSIAGRMLVSHGRR